MKNKSLLLLLALISTATGFAQMSSQVKSADDLTKMLSTDYTMIENTATTVPNNTFTLGECKVFTSYADEAINKQAAEVQKQFGETFTGSIWKFGAHSKSALAMVSVTAKGKTEQSSYTPSGGTFIVPGLIQGLEINAYLYQHKVNKNVHIMLFTVTNGMMCAAEFTKQ